MIYLRLFYEFFKTGLFSVGGGLATIPFLSDIGVRTGWFSATELANMIAVSESTPGPIGLNMATYVGYATAGIPGSVVATLGLIAPSILVILIIAGFLEKFRQARAVDAVFYGLRPASTGLIAAADIVVAKIALFHGAVSLSSLHYGAILLALAVFLCMQFTPMKKLHPIVFILFSAAVGVVFQF